MVGEKVGARLTSTQVWARSSALGQRGVERVGQADLVGEQIEGGGDHRAPAEGQPAPKRQRGGGDQCVEVFAQARGEGLLGFFEQALRRIGGDHAFQAAVGLDQGLPGGLGGFGGGSGFLRIRGAGGLDALFGQPGVGEGARQAQLLWLRTGEVEGQLLLLRASFGSRRGAAGRPGG